MFTALEATFSELSFLSQQLCEPAFPRWRPLPSLSCCVLRSYPAWSGQLLCPRAPRGSDLLCLHRLVGAGHTRH